MDVRRDEHHVADAVGVDEPENIRTLGGIPLKPVAGSQHTEVLDGFRDTNEFPNYSGFFRGQ